MRINSKRSERGQVLFLIVLSVIGVLGFAALAIDGGMIYSERRVAQNAADASAYAGAAALSQEVKNYTAGEFNCDAFNVTTGDSGWNDEDFKPLFGARAAARAADNNFTITYTADPSSVTQQGNAVWMVCGFDNKLKYEFVDVHVRITKQVSTSLMHLFSKSIATNTVDSVVRVYPPEGVATDASVVGLCSLESGEADPDGDLLADDDIGISIGGSSKINITTGKVISNCNVDLHGGNLNDPWNIEDDIWSMVEPDKNTLTAPLSADTTLNWPVPKTEFPYDFGDRLSAQCNTLPLVNPTIKKGNTTTIQPGRHTNNITINGNNTTVVFAPGLHCIYGTLTVTNGGTVGATDFTKYALYANNVTFFVDENAGAFSINGGINLMTAANETTLPGVDLCANTSGSTSPVKNLIMWNDTAAKSKQVIINGNGESVFTGSIFAPWQDITINGDDTVDSSEFGFQIIADNVTITGKGDVSIQQDGSEIFTTCAQMGLER